MDGDEARWKFPNTKKKFLIFRLKPIDKIWRQSFICTIQKHAIKTPTDAISNTKPPVNLYPNTSAHQFAPYENEAAINAATLNMH